MAIPELRGKVPTEKPADLNLFATFCYGHKVPLLADDWAHALMGTEIRWDHAFLYHIARQDFGKKPLKDPFGIGFEGSDEDLIINAAVKLASLSSLDELPGDEAFWQSFAIVCEKWEKWIARLMQDRGIETLPLPPKPTPISLPTIKVPQRPITENPQQNRTEPIKPIPEKVDWHKWVNRIMLLLSPVVVLTPFVWDDIALKVLQWILTLFMP